MTFDEAFGRLMGYEGEFSANPADPGGATRWGITERVARKHGYRGDMRELPLELAKKIAHVEYWDAGKVELVPEIVRFDLFDGIYNSGPVQATKWLQRAAGVVADGILGPKTLAALASQDPEALVARYNGYRLDFLNDLKTWPVFGRGWAQRIANNLIATKG